MVGAGDAFGVLALASTAGVGGVEEVEAAFVAEEVGAFDHAALPGLVVGDELGRGSGEAEEIGRKGLGPEGGGFLLRVAVGLPDEERVAVLVAGEGGVDGAERFGEDGAVVGPWAAGRGGGGDGDREWAATGAGDIVGEELFAVVDEFGSPEGAFGPRGLYGEDGSGHGPVGEVGGLEERELRTPLAGGRRSKVTLADAEDGGVGGDRRG